MADAISMAGGAAAAMDLATAAVKTVAATDGMESKDFMVAQLEMTQAASDFTIAKGLADAQNKGGETLARAIG